MESKRMISFKFLLLGETGVGKSSLIQRFVHGNFNERHVPTDGIDVANKKLNVDGHDIYLQILDTAGPDKMSRLTNTYYRNCHGVMIVYDITKQESFEIIGEFLRDVRDFCGDIVSVSLVGNKVDLQTNRAVDYTTAKEYAEEEKIDFIETSAKETTNAEEAFMKLIRTALGKKMNASDSKQSEAKVTKDDSKARTCNLL